MDLIDRQAAIDAFDKQNWSLLNIPICKEIRNAAKDTIKALPAVQTCDDAVSRADVIELVKDSYYNLAESIEDTWAMVADVEKLPAVQPQPEEDCDTCKHGYFGSRQCDNCRVRYPSHYEREEEQHA